MKTKQQIIDDGREAERLLKDTDLKRFLAEIEQDCWLEFKITGTNDSDSREAIYMKLRGVELVRQSLRAMVDNGAIEIKSK
ncbi:MAG: hypothetical protein CMJ25_07365 [Phycisphaerae bacterium]|nr:hypothetical protein [Phycisphaerae bacterium]